MQFFSVPIPAVKLGFVDKQCSFYGPERDSWLLLLSFEVAGYTSIKEASLKASVVPACDQVLHINSLFTFASTGVCEKSTTRLGLLVTASFNSKQFQILNCP